MYALIDVVGMCLQMGCAMVGIMARSHAAFDHWACKNHRVIFTFCAAFSAGAEVMRYVWLCAQRVDTSGPIELYIALAYIDAAAHTIRAASKPFPRWGLKSTALHAVAFGLEACLAYFYESQYAVGLMMITVMHGACTTLEYFGDAMLPLKHRQQQQQQRVPAAIPEPKED